MTLPTASWYPPNHAALVAFLERQAARPGPKVAVTDWDDTCVFRCLGTAAFRVMIDELDLRLSPEQLAEAIEPAWGGVEVSAQGVRFSDLRDDILELYEALWPWISKGRGREARQARPQQWRDLRARLGFLYPATEETEGVGAAVAYGYLAWLCGAGRTEAELEALSDHARRVASAEPPGRGRFDAATPMRSGLVGWDFAAGFAPLAELRDIAAALGRAGVTLWVVTASVEGVVRAGVRALGFAVPPERVLGIRVAKDASGVMLPRLAEGWPLTWRQGKVDVIREVIGAPPLYVAGDTNTDFDMLTAFPETELRLIINRGSSGDIERLYAHALGEPAGFGGELGGLTLLQGRDDALSGLWPGQAARKLPS